MLALRAKTKPDEAEAEGFDCSKLEADNEGWDGFRRNASLLSAEGCRKTLSAGSRQSGSSCKLLDSLPPVLKVSSIFHRRN
jgi:hypothetical protein